MDSEAELSLVIKARNLASREVDRLGGALGRVRTGAGRLGGALATLTKVGILGLVTGAIALVAALGGAAEASAKEQVGIKRLDAALKANVKGFKGNTDAIEKVIQKREALGFADDEQRDSLAMLVTKYHNVERAQRIQAVAMDLARLKGISLAQATDLVSKGLDGSTRVLKQLGIEVDKDASKHDILRAIMKKTEGQAEAYGKTAAGAQEAFGIAVGDLVEDIGTGLQPILTQVFTFLRTEALPAIRRVIGAVSKWMEDNKPLINQLTNFAKTVLANVIEAVKKVVNWIGNVFNAITSNKELMAFFGEAFNNIAGFVTTLWNAISQLVDWLSKVWASLSGNKDVVNAARAGFDLMGKAIGTVIDALKWLLDNAGKVIGFLQNLKFPDLSGLPHFAAGGTSRGGLAVVGEKGPELVRLPRGATVYPNSALSGPSGRSEPAGVMLRGVSESDINRMIDRGLYFRLQRAGTGS